MLYTVGEVARRLGIAPSTVRYYDRKGLLPFVERTVGGTRMFSEEDYEWLLVIHCLKEAGMQLKDIREFTEMALDGDESIDERLSLFIQQREIIEQQMADLQLGEDLSEGSSAMLPGELRLEDIQSQYQIMRKRLQELSDDPFKGP